MKGYNTHRHKNNPKEKELHEKFVNDFIERKYGDKSMDRLVFGHDNNHFPNDHLSDREKKNVISTIQWLGSPVGQGFLRDCGFEVKEESWKI